MLKQSSPAEEGVLRTSKFLTVQVLLDAAEMEQLLIAVGNPSIAQISGIVGADEAFVAPDKFLAVYAAYANALSEGKLPEDPSFRLTMSTAWTRDLDALYAMAIEGNRQLVKVRRPVVQLQPHTFDYSPADQKFRPMVLGGQTISWGVQFSFPQIYEDPHSRAIMETQTLENGKLYKEIQRWLRHNSIPTPFLVEGRQQNSPIRLGKNCFTWIHRHPQLANRGIEVKRV